MAGPDHSASLPRRTPGWGVPAVFITLGLIWGSSFLWIKVAVATLDPQTLIAYRIGLGALGMLVYLRLRGGAEQPHAGLQPADRGPDHPYRVRRLGAGDRRAGRLRRGRPARLARVRAARRSAGHRRRGGGDGG